jgi:hypothetical protein
LSVIRPSADLDPEGPVLGIREITGYVAHLLLVGYWLWVVFSAAPQLRRGSRDRRVRMEVLLIKTAGFVLTGLVVGVITSGPRSGGTSSWPCSARPGSGCC